MNALTTIDLVGCIITLLCITFNIYDAQSYLVFTGSKCLDLIPALYQKHKIIMMFTIFFDVIVTGLLWPVFWLVMYFTDSKNE